MRQQASFAMSLFLVASMTANQEPLEIIAGAADKPLIIGDVEIPCYVLEDETRVITKSGLSSSLGSTETGKVEGYGEMPIFATKKWLNPFIGASLTAAMKSPILFKLPTGGTAFGHPATVLAESCSAIVEAHKQGSATPRQALMVDRAYILLRGFAIVRITALVDEATGYQDIRDKNTLQSILERIIDRELNPYTKTFPLNFYREIYRLRGLNISDALNHKRPLYFGILTNDIVCDRIEPGVVLY